LFFENTHGGNITTFRSIENGNCEQNLIWNQNLIFEKAKQFCTSTKRINYFVKQQIDFCAVN